MALPRRSPSTRSFFRKNSEWTLSRDRGGAGSKSRSSVFSISTVSDSDPFSASIILPETYQASQSSASHEPPRVNPPRAPDPASTQHSQPQVQTPRINIISPSASVHYLFDHDQDVSEAPTEGRPLSKNHHRHTPQTPTGLLPWPGPSSSPSRSLSSPPNNTLANRRRSSIPALEACDQPSSNEDDSTISQDSTSELGYLRSSISMHSLRRKPNFDQIASQGLAGCEWSPAKPEQLGAKGLKRMDSLIVAERRAKRDRGPWRMPLSASKRQQPIAEQSAVAASGLPPAQRHRSSTIGSSSIAATRLVSAARDIPTDLGCPVLQDSHDRPPSFSHIEFYPASVPMRREPQSPMTPIFPRKKYQSLAAARSVPMLRDIVTPYDTPTSPLRHLPAPRDEMQRHKALDETWKIVGGARPTSVAMSRNGTNVGPRPDPIKQTVQRDRALRLHQQGLPATRVNGMVPLLPLRRSKSEQRMPFSRMAGIGIELGSPPMAPRSDRTIHLGDPSLRGRHDSMPKPATLPRPSRISTPIALARETQVLDVFDSITWTHDRQKGDQAKVYGKPLLPSLRSDISLLAPSSFTGGGSTKSTTTLPQSLLDELVDLTDSAHKHRKEDNYASSHTSEEADRSTRSLNVELRDTETVTVDRTQVPSQIPWSTIAGSAFVSEPVGVAITTDQARPSTMARLRCKASSDLGSVTGSIKSVFRKNSALGRSLSNLLDPKPNRKQTLRTLARPISGPTPTDRFPDDQHRREKLLRQAVSMSLSSSARAERSTQNTSASSADPPMHSDSLRSTGALMMESIAEEVAEEEQTPKVGKSDRAAGRLHSKSVGRLLDEVQRRTSIFSGASVYSSEAATADQRLGLSDIVQRLRGERSLAPWPAASSPALSNQRMDEDDKGSAFNATKPYPAFASPSRTTPQSKNRPRARSMRFDTPVAMLPLSSSDPHAGHTVLGQLWAREAKQTPPGERNAEDKARKVMAWRQKVDSQDHLSKLERRMEEHVEQEKETFSRLSVNLMSMRDFGSSYA